MGTESVTGRWLARLVRRAWYFGDNWLSQVGVMLTTASAVTIVTFFTTHFFGVDPGPYVGILAALVLPAVFVLGLGLIPLGMWWRLRRERRAGRLPATIPPIDLREPRVRETLWFVVVMSGLNVALFLAVTYRAVHEMESVQFCGTTCHRVMQPEHTAYLAASHARVPCVDCHIGPGAPWFVRSKISGSWQVLAVAFDLHPRPIPTPIENLRPSRETCEQCHWPEKFVGDKLLVRTHFSDDETAEETKTVLLMRIGGLDPLTGRPLGNHGVHLHPGTEIRYRPLDHQRQEIGLVRLRKPDGTVVDYLGPAAAGGAAAPPADGELRLMDCLDCHNRPAHPFEQPGTAVDTALAAGAIDRSLPFVRRQALAVLQAEYASHADATARIPESLRAFYGTEHPDVLATRRKAIDAAGDVLVGLYRRNVFPQMRVTWGTYPSNLGHDPTPGCFRCHDGKHTSAAGDTITDDCSACHQLLATEESEPEILKQLAGE